MAYPNRGFPECDFGIVIRNRGDAEEIHKIAKEYYPDITRRRPAFNASNDHIYYVIKEGEEILWDHKSEGRQPKEITEILTLKEFKDKYINKPKEEIINNYQIY